MLTLDQIAEIIRTERKKRGFSQSQLSQIANVSRAQIDRLENGRQSDTGFRAILRLQRVVVLSTGG